MMNNNTSSLSKKGSVWINLDATFRRVDMGLGDTLKPMGVYPREAYVLAHLLTNDGIHASDLAKAGNIPPTSFTPILDKLVADLWVEKRSDPDDRRAVRVFLKDSQKPDVEGIVAAVNGYDHDVLLGAGLSYQEVETFFKVLKTIRDRG